jgi:hypothetical protein
MAYQEERMRTEQWAQISRTLDYIMAQPTGKPIKESPGATAVRGEAPKPQRKPKKKEQPPEQLRLF